MDLLSSGLPEFDNLSICFYDLIFNNMHTTVYGIGQTPAAEQSPGSCLRMDGSEFMRLISVFQMVPEGIVDWAGACTSLPPKLA
jgi:hypothetical protein